MTNAEIIAYQKAARAHREALPRVVAELSEQMLYQATREPVPDTQRLEVEASQIRTLLREIERLGAQVKQLREDVRDGERSARDAYSEGRHDGFDEARGGGW